MIVRGSDHALHLISQPDHAALARRVMERWTPLYDAPRRASILLAVEEHDNGWHEPDGAPQVDPATGRVFDFIQIAAEVRQGVWPRGVGRLAQQDMWAAALVAQHAVTIYDRFRTDNAWSDFFSRLERLRDELAAPTRLSSSTLTHDYAFVRIGDLISLIFCTHWDEPQVFGNWTFQREDDRVLVTPDPFAGREVPIAVNAREIPARPYTDDDDLRRTLRNSPIVTLRGVVKGA
jgi:hypothetical protein